MGIMWHQQNLVRIIRIVKKNAEYHIHGMYWGWERMDLEGDFDFDW